MMETTRPVLIGNSFPLPLVRRAVRIVPLELGAAREALAGRCVRSFWGHPQTAVAAGALLGVDLASRTERPSLSLSPDGLPVLDGETFSECYVLSPDYRPGFRPAPGMPVEAGDIQGWQALRLTWE